LIRRTWPVLVSLAISGGVAGTAIAGLPDSGPDAIVVLAPTSVTSVGTIVASEAPAPAVAPNASGASITAVPSDASGAAVGSDGSGASVGSVGDPAVDVADRQHIRLVIVSGDGGRADLAMQGAGRMSAAGYTQFFISDEQLSADVTTVYYRPGFDNEAWMVSGDLLMPAAPLQPLPAAGVSSDDAQADIVIVLGTDYVA
jgi:hypothetical protein